MSAFDTGIGRRNHEHAEVARTLPVRPAVAAHRAPPTSSSAPAQGKTVIGASSVMSAADETQPSADGVDT